MNLSFTKLCVGGESAFAVASVIDDRRLGIADAEFHAGALQLKRGGLPGLVDQRRRELSEKAGREVPAQVPPMARCNFIRSDTYWMG